ncbi:hypothetical protein Tco_1502259, partial [Tanacetum coccineum]
QEMETLKGKVDQLSKAGFRAELLSSTDLLEVEPTFVNNEEGSLMQDLIRDSDIELDIPIKPQKVRMKLRVKGPSAGYR